MYEHKRNIVGGEALCCYELVSLPKDWWASTTAAGDTCTALVF